MTTNYFFSVTELSDEKFQELENIFFDAEGIFPFDQLNYFINNFVTNIKSFLYALAKYAVYRGIEIASQDEFFNQFDESGSINHPGTIFWRAYDALIRGKIPVFKKIWSYYEAQELKNYSQPFIAESIVIPEDPLFLNVQTIVYEHQQRLINHFVLEKCDSKTVSDSDFDTILQTFLGKSSLLLSFFRLQQFIFQRNLTFLDLDNLLALITEENMDTLGSYWEIRFLTIISYWKVELGLVFDVVENLLRLKNLNSVATSFLVESQIFHLEAQIAFKNNQILDCNELLQSSYFLATEFDFFFHRIEVLFSKLALDKESIAETIKTFFEVTSEKDHPLIRSRVYANLGAYYIQEKNWSEAEKNLLQSSKLIQGSFDKKTYFQVISDFSYVLVISNQLKEALEASAVLLDDNVPLLFRIRGFYIHGLTLFLLQQQNNAIDIIEEGLRITLTFKEHISLPWFYELLSLIYISLNDWETASSYGQLAFKSYFDSSNFEAGNRSKIISSYLLALKKDFGSSFNLIQSTYAEISSGELQLEAFTCLQSIVIASHEPINLEKIVDRNLLDLNTNEFPIISVINRKDHLFFSQMKEYNISFKTINLLNFKNYSYLFEEILFQIIAIKDNFTLPENFLQFLDKCIKLITIFNKKIIIFNHMKDLLANLKNQLETSGEIQKNFIIEVENLLYSSILVNSVIRLIIVNLPFNFLFDEQNFNIKD
jgi:hypothetical protein